MLDYLKRLVNLYLLVTLIAMGLAVWLRLDDLITGGECVEVIRAGLALFVGGGFLREGLTAFASQPATASTPTTPQASHP